MRQNSESDVKAIEDELKGYQNRAATAVLRAIREHRTRVPEGEEQAYA